MRLIIITTLTAASLAGQQLKFSPRPGVLDSITSSSNVVIGDGPWGSGKILATIPPTGPIRYHPDTTPEMVIRRLLRVMQEQSTVAAEEHNRNLSECIAGWDRTLKLLDQVIQRTEPVAPFPSKRGGRL